MSEAPARGWPRDRIVAPAGRRNFRDPGGYPGEGGRRVRRGLLVRSGVLTG